MAIGPAPFYSLQDVQAAQGAPSDPTGDQTQYDSQAQPMPAQGLVGPQPAPLQGAQPGPSAGGPMMWPPSPLAPPPQAQPQGPPMSPMGPQGPVPTQPPSGDLSATVPDLQTRMAQYLAMTRPVYDRMKMPLYGANVPRPTGVQQFFSMGQMAHEWANRASQHDAQATAYNNSLDAQALAAAQKMMQADSTAQLAQARFGLEQNRFTLESLRMQAAESDRRVSDELKQLQNERAALKFQFQFPSPNPAGAPPSAPSADAPGMPAGGDFTPPAPGSPLAEPSSGASAPASPAASAGAASSNTMQPGEDLYSFGQRRKNELAAEAAAKKQQMQGSDEINRNADLVEAHLTPGLDAAIDSVLPKASGAGVVSRMKAAGNASVLNPLNSGFRNRLANGDPQATQIASLVTAAIPFIRATAGGTKGVRLTQTELNLLTEDNLKRLAAGDTTNEQGHAIVTMLRNVLARVRGQAGGGPAAPATPVPSAPAAATTGNYQTTPGGRRYRVVQ